MPYPPDDMDEEDLDELRRLGDESMRSLHKQMEEAERYFVWLKTIVYVSLISLSIFAIWAIFGD